jgi:hypothetical protein
MDFASFIGAFLGFSLAAGFAYGLFENLDDDDDDDEGGTPLLSFVPI